MCIPVFEVSENKLTALVGPHVQLLGQLGYHQERPPALALLGLEDVSEDVVPDVDDVLPFGRQQVAHNVGGTWEEDARGRLITDGQSYSLHPLHTHTHTQGTDDGGEKESYHQSRRYHAAEVPCRFLSLNAPLSKVRNTCSRLVRGAGAQSHKETADMVISFKWRLRLASVNLKKRKRPPVSKRLLFLTVVNSRVVPPPLSGAKVLKNLCVVYSCQIVRQLVCI